MKTKIKNKLIIFLILFLTIGYIPLVKASTDYAEQRYLQKWFYNEGNVLFSIYQTIIVSVGYDYLLSNNIITTESGFLSGTAVDGNVSNFPFEEYILLIEVNWYKNGSLVQHITSFDYPPIIYDPDNVACLGKYYSSTLNLKTNYDTWKQTGTIEVYAPETLNIYNYYSVTNY